MAPAVRSERAALVTCAPYAEAAQAPAPAFRVGSARALIGHEATVPIAPGAPSLDARAGALDADGMLAAVLAEDLCHADAAEAERAILGYTLLLAWRPGLSAQLGSVLVTRDEAGDLTSLRTLFRVGGATLPTSDAGVRPFSPPEAIASISHHVPLQAGDVIGAGRLRGACASDAGARLSFGMRVELAIERLGRLCGRATEGPDLPPGARSNTVRAEERHPVAMAARPCGCGQPALLDGGEGGPGAAGGRGVAPLTSRGGA